MAADISRASSGTGNTSQSRTTWRLEQGAAVKYWEIIADNLSKHGWSWGCVSAVDSEGRPIFVADAHRDDGKRFVVQAHRKLDRRLVYLYGAGLRKREGHAACSFFDSDRAAVLNVRARLVIGFMK
jgi:hypothetical protein